MQTRPAIKIPIGRPKLSTADPAKGRIKIPIKETIEGIKE